MTPSIAPLNASGVATWDSGYTVSGVRFPLPGQRLVTAVMERRLKRRWAAAMALLSLGTFPGFLLMAVAIYVMASSPARATA